VSARTVTVAVAVALATLATSAGVAVAVGRSRVDAPAALPAVCRDAPGGAGGSLPDGAALDQAFGRTGDGSTGTPDPQALARGLGAGTPAERAGRLQALQGGRGDAGASGGSSTGAPGAPAPPAQRGGQPGGGDGAGGRGGSGQGSGTGSESGPGGGSGDSRVPGSGPDRAGAPQEFVPSPPPTVRVDPPPQAAPPRRRAVPAVLSGLLSALVLLGASLLAARLLPRRRPGVTALPDATGMAPADADARAASAAEGADHDAALRWTFVAGLLRLDEAGVVPYDPARTTRDVARRLRSDRFRGLARAFDLVAYGGRHATAADVASARSGWTVLLAEVRPTALAGPVLR